MRILGTVLLALLGTGCVGSKLEAPFAAGQYQEVARMFEADSALQNRERAIYLAALAYALPESPAYEPRRAIQTLERLLSLYPGSSHRSEALHLREILQHTERVARELADTERRLEIATAALEAQRATLRELEELHAEERSRADGLQAISDRLSREVRERSARIQALEEELAALKQLDLNRPPPEPALRPDTSGPSR